MNANPVTKAIRIVGRVTKLASKLGVTHQAVRKWERHNRVPAERCRSIEEATKGAVTRYELRPDVFGPPPGDNDFDRGTAA